MHPPYPHPGWALDQILANHVHAMETAPLQTVAGWLWALLILIAAGTFLVYCVVSIRSGVRKIMKRRGARDQDSLAKYGGQQLEVEVDTQLWEQVLRDAGVEDL